MGFNYNDLKQQDQHQLHWATYSDLFMVFSVVFLLLYTVSSLRTSTQNLLNLEQVRQIQAENEDLKQQLKVYEVQKDHYLQTKASQKEQQNYDELIQHLSLLQNNIQNENQQLKLQAKKNAQKKQSLNKYQKMIQNIINANMVKAHAIKERNRRVANIKQQKNKINKKHMQLAMALAESEKDLDSIKTKLAHEQKKLLNEKKQKSFMVKKFEATRLAYKEQIKNLKQKQQAAKAQLKQQVAAKQKELKQQNLSAAAHKKALKKFKSQAQRQAQNQQKQYAKQVASLQNKIKSVQGDLKKALKNSKQTKQLARKLKEALKQSNLQAQVNQKTGDVVISFKDEYFDTDKYKLKDGMKSILQQFVPLYAQTLFSNPEVAKKINQVEVVGFASPTYRGKFVDPRQVSRTSKQAINYNLDLSYRRAKSIFSYILDSDKLQGFKNRKKLMSLIKVSGRSFLAEKTTRQPAEHLSSDDFCKLHDCKKAQKVIIKFNLD